MKKHICFLAFAVSVMSAWGIVSPLYAGNGSSPANMQYVSTEANAYLSPAAAPAAATAPPNLADSPAYQSGNDEVAGKDCYDILELIIMGTPTVTQKACNGASDGKVSVTFQGAGLTFQVGTSASTATKPAAYTAYTAPAYSSDNRYTYAFPNAKNGDAVIWIKDANGAEVSAAINAAVTQYAAVATALTNSNQTVCSSSPIATITPSSSNPTGGSFAYSWTRNNTTNVTGLAASGTGAISGTLTNATTAKQTVAFTVTTTFTGTDGAVCKATNPATVTVGHIPAAPVATSATICGAGPATLTASGAKTGEDYRWLSTANVVLQEGGASYVVNLTQGQVQDVRVVVVDKNTSASCTSTYTAVQAKSVSTADLTVPKQVIVNKDNERCGDGTVTLKVEPTTGSLGAEIFVWYPAIGGASLTTGTSYTTPSITTSTTYMVGVRNTGTGCETAQASRVPVVAIVNANPAAPTATSATVARCGTGTVTLSATTVTGITHNWYAAATNGAILANGTATSNFTTPSISTSTTYYVEAKNTTTNCVSPSRTPIVARIDDVPTVPGAADITRCGTGDITLVATGAGTGEDYRWYTAAAGGSPIQSGTNYLVNVTAGTAVTVYVEKYNTTTNCASTMRKEVKAIAIDAADLTPPVQAITNKDNERCGSGTVTLSVTPVTLPAGETYVWYNGATEVARGVSTYTTPAISASATYHVTTLNTLHQCEGQRVPVVAIVHANPAAPTATSATVARCGTGTVTLSATTVTGITHNWYATATNGAILAGGTATSNFTTPSISTSTTYYVEAKNTTTNCVSPSRTPIVARIDDVPTEPGASDVTRCGAGDVMLVATGAGANEDYRWYTVPTGGTVIPASGGPNHLVNLSTAPATVTVYVEKYNTTTHCVSATRKEVKAVSLDVAALTVPVAVPGVHCGEGVVSLSVTPATPKAGERYVWYDAGDAKVAENVSSYTTPTLSTSTTYYVTTLNTDYQCESQRVPVTATINAIPSAPVTIPNVARCESEPNSTITVDRTGVPADVTFRWYNAAAGGSSIHTGNTYAPAITQTQTFYVEAYSGAGCVSTTRKAVTAYVNANPAVPAFAATQNVCEGNALVFSANTVTGVTYNWEGSTSGGVSLGASAASYEYRNAAPGTYSVVVKASQLYNNSGTPHTCYSGTVTKSAEIFANPAAPTITDPASVCAGTELLFTATPAAGAACSWTSTAGGVANACSYTIAGANATAGLKTVTVRSAQTHTNGVAGTVTCFSAPVTSSASVVPVPQGGASLTLQQSCNVIYTTENASSYTWYKSAAGTDTQIATGTSASYTISENATYKLRASNIAGGITCSGPISAGRYFYIQPSKPVIVVAKGCGGDTLKATNVLGAVAGTTIYRWYKGGAPLTFGGASTYLATQSGSDYTVTAENPGSPVCPSEMSDPQSVTITPTPTLKPVLTASPDESVCAMPITLTAAGGNGAAYRWYEDKSDGLGLVAINNPGSAMTVTSTGAGTYAYAVVSVNDNCAGPRSEVLPVRITATAPGKITINESNTTQCGGSVVLTTDGLGSEPGAHYQWYMDGAEITGATTTVHPASEIGTHTYTVKAHLYACEAATASDPVTVEITPSMVTAAPNISPMPVGNVAVRCFEDTPYNLSATTVTNATSYQWYRNGIKIDGATATTYSVTSGAATYTVSGVADNCPGPQSKAITVVIIDLQNAPEFVPSTATATTCYDSPLALTVTPSYDNDFYAYYWYRSGDAAPAATTTVPTYTPPVSGVYSVKGVYADGAIRCESPVSETKEVIILPDVRIATGATTLSASSGRGFSISVAPSGFTPDPAGAMSYSWSMVVDNPSAVTPSGDVTVNTGTSNLIEGAFTYVYPDDMATYTATFTIKGTYTLNNVSCESNPLTVTVLIKPKPDNEASPSVQAICNNGNIRTINLVSSEPELIDYYDWTCTMPPGITSPNIQSSATNYHGDPINGSFANTTNSPQTVTFTFVPYFKDEPGVAQESFTARVIVLPTFAGAVDGDAARVVCSGEDFTMDFTTDIGDLSGGTVAYDWTITGLPAGVTPNLSVSPGPAITGTIVNATGAAETVQFAITPQYILGGAACTGASFTATVTVNTGSTVTPSVSADELCSGGTVMLSVEEGAHTPGATFEWSLATPASMEANATGGTVLPASVQLVNTSALPATATFTVTPMLASCPGTPATVEVTVNPAITIAATTTAAVCAGADNGAISATATGGGGALTYTLKQGNTLITEQPAGDFTGLLPGTYTVVATDGICTASVQAIVGGPTEALSGAIAAQKDAVCGNGGSATATVAFGTGTAPYTYTLSGGVSNTTGIFTNLQPGSYTIEISDANSCTAPVALPLVIGGSTATLAATVTATGVTCNAGADGTLNVTVTDGLPYTAYRVLRNGAEYGTYNVANLGSANTITGLPAGSYTVIVIDEVNGCQSAASNEAIIAEPAPIAYSYADITAQSACNVSDGSAVITVTGGNTGPYQFEMTNGLVVPAAPVAAGSTYQLAGLSAGESLIFIVDSKGCRAPATVRIPSANAAMTSGVKDGTLKPVLCFGSSTGGFEVEATGGTQPYTYNYYTYTADGVAWSAPVAHTTATFTGLAAGTYQVVLSDAAACTSTVEVFVEQPASPLAATTQATAVTCFGANDGAAAVYATGGTAPYTYAWSTGATTSSIASLSPATYAVTVTDANGCSAEAQATVTGPAAALSVSDVTAGAANCDNIATVALRVTGGTAPFAFSLNGAALKAADYVVNGDGAAELYKVPAGTFELAVTDANACSATTTVTVDPKTNNLSATVANTPEAVTCVGDNSSIVLTVAGGAPFAGDKYEFRLNNNAPVMVAPEAGSYTIDDLGAGDYTVTVRDADNCSFSVPVAVNVPAAVENTLRVNVTVLQVLDCNRPAQPDGQMQVAIAGGAMPYSITYKATDGSEKTIDDINTNTYTEENLPAGYYAVMVTDAEGCKMKAAAEGVITQPDPVTFTTLVTAPLCVGDANGSIAVINPQGGNPANGYSYSKDGVTYGAGTTFGNLAAGAYRIYVRDNSAHACTGYADVTVAGKEPLAITAVVTPPATGVNNGTITLTATGGTQPYTYSKDNAYYQQSNIFGNIGAGEYYVSVKDNNGCTATAPAAIVVAPAPGSSFTIVPTVTAAGCSDGATGAVALAVTGGAGSFEYTMNAADESTWKTEPVFTGLQAGDYTIFIRDAAGTVNSVNVTIANAAPISVSAAYVADATPRIEVTATGGTAPLQYSLNGQTWSSSAAFANPPAGENIIYVKDGNSCENTTTTVIVPTGTPPETIAYTVAVSGSANCGAEAIHITNVSGGNGNYTYKYKKDNADWVSSAETTATSYSIDATAGTYVLQVVDNAGEQSATYTVTVTMPAAGIDLSATATAACYGSATGAITLTATGGSGIVQYAIDGATFQNLGTFSGLAARDYTVWARDAAGCRVSQSITVSAGQPVVLDVTAIANASTADAADGSVTLAATGGNGDFTYAKAATAEYQASNLFNNLPKGAYTFFAKDGNGCIGTAPVTLAAATDFPDVLSLTAAVTQEVTCSSAADGQVTVKVFGATGEVEYSKDNTAWQTEPLFTGLAAGIYTFYAKDAIGARGQVQITVDAPAPLIVVPVLTHAVTAGNDAEVTVTATGGFGALTYAQDAGAFGSSNVFGTLDAGSYTFKAKDANGCTAEGHIVIGMPNTPPNVNILTITATVVDALTCARPATVMLTATGGLTNKYRFSADNGATWKDGGSNYSVAITAPGTYYFQAAQGGLESNVVELVFGQPALNDFALTVDVAASSLANCYDTDNAFVTLTATGGNGTNRWYRITGGEWTTSSVFSGLAAGAYRFEAKDEKGCTVLTDGTIKVATPTSKLSVSAVVSGTAPAASVTVTATGGVPDYQYSKDALTFDTNNVLADYDEGAYYVYARDNDGAGCIDSAKVQIGDANSLSIGVGNITHVSNYGGNDGSVTFNVSGGSDNYEILVNGEWVSLAKVDGLYAGDYVFYVRDDAGKTGSIAITITQPEPLAITAITLVSFTADGKATVNVTVVGGTQPYTYSKDGALYGTSSLLGGYSGGLQTVFAKDKNGYVVSATAHIPSSADDIMVSAFVSKGITCEGLADAEVTVTASNGTAPYQYSKTGADNTWNGNALLSGFAPGMQKVYVRDAKGKTAYTLVDVKAPVALRIATYVQAPSAPAAVDGIVTVNVVQGVAPFTYSKFSNSGWQPSAILAGFGAGPYTVYAKDANNCPAVSATGHITYEAPDGINAGASVWQHVTCYAGSDGIINLTATGGTETDSYAFTINGGAATNFDNANSHTITGLAPGTYTIMVTKGSESIPAPLTVVINAPAQLTLTATATGATCYGEENAVIVATATGGAGLFKEYSINGAEWTTAGTFTNLGAGLRTVYARDAYGCVATANVTVNQPSAPLTFTVQVVQYSNTDAANDGIVEVDNVAGGVAPYLFSNSDTWTSERRFTGLAHGHHVIYAKDANGCIASYNIYVPNKTTDNSDFDVDAYVSKPLTCATGADAEITFVSSASDIGYSVDRQTYVTTEVLTGFAAGQHTLYARSPNTPAGKVVTVKVEVLPVTPLAIESVAVIPAITETTPLASVNITAKGGTAPLQYRLDTTTDTPNPIITGVVAGSYTVTVTDANGCEATAPLLVNDKPVTGAGSRVSITANVTQALKCAGANNAQITITATGASGAYMYSIDNGTTWNAGSGVRVFTGLPAGTYEIMVRDAADAANQSGVLTLVIAEPALWSITAAATTNVVCTGEATGQITVTSATPGLQYAKNRQDWSANNVLTGFAAGTYIVFAKDDLGCVREASAVVTQNTNPLTITNAAVTKAITLANGAEITLTVAGGTPAYTYALAGNAAASNKLQNVAAGTHQVTVTDANGCIASVTVPVSASGDGITTLSAQATALPKCYADATGEITVTIKGGQAPYVYTNGIDEVTLSALTHVFTALQGGSYPITVTDANGYTLTQEVSVDAPEPLTLSAWGSDGGIVVAEAKGGTPVYSYYLNNTPPISSNVFSGLAVGTYVVNVTDANGCVAQTQTPIEVIDKNKPNENNFSIKAEVTNSVSCTGADGEVTITVMDGTGTFMYAKGDGAYQPSNVFAGLTAGEHVFAAKNATTDLTKRVTVTLPDNGPLTLSVAKIVPVSAATATDGKVTLQAGGGKRPYQYKNAANTEWQNAFVFDGLAATTYTMLVKDATGCEATISVSLAGEGGLMPSIKTQGNVTCYGGNNGWAEIYVTGGSGNYSYSLDNYTWQPSRRLTGLRAGTHTLYVRDNTTLGTSKVTVAITQPAAPLVLTAAPVAPVNPVGSNTAAVKLTAQGGTPAYHYAGTAKVWDIKEVMTGFAPGYHTLFVQDANKCVDSAMVNIGDGATAISLSAVVSKPLTCLGSADAEITLTAGNGTGSYLYAKDGSHWATANVMTGFAAGTYTLHAKDATTGATIATYVEVVMPEQLSATAVVSKPVSGEGQADGEVKFMPAGGTAPYQYRTETGSWQSEDVIVGLPVGTHTFYVKDANNCAETMVRVVMGVDTGASSGTKVSLTATVSGKVTCNNAATGAIAAIARDGDGTFEFSLNGGAWVSATANTYTFTALAAGTYNVAVRSGGQTATVNQLVIAGIAPLSATVAVTDVLCYGQSDGKAVITATGGTAPYQYARTGYAMNGSNEITGLGAGTHLLFVKDAMGCETTVTAAVKPVNKLTLTATVARVITYAGGDNAVVEAKATGGTPGAIGYHYSKTGAAWIYNSNLVPNYGPGQAKVYVRDANNCVAEAAVFIGDYSSSASNTISVTAIVSRPLSCYDNSDAAITLTATGGTPDYTYSKDGVNYAAGAVLTGFPAGEHTVYVKDTKGKVAGVTVTVAPLLPITAYAVVSDNGQNKMATVIAEGGSNSYNYAITPNVSRTGNVFAPMAAGAYTIIVSDANSGCEAAPIYLNVGAGANDVSLSASVTNPLGCLDGNNAEITAVVSGGVAPYRFSRNNGTFQTGSNIFVYANLGAGTYAIVAKDAVGTLSNTVNVPVTSIAAAPLAITAVTARTNTCYGTDNGAITITANGGVPVLQYSISGVDYQLNNTFNRQQLQQGHHHVYVKDALGCVQQSEVTIDTVPEQLQLLIMSTTPPATGSNNGVIVAEAAGGTPVYVYTNGATTQEDDGTFAGLTANTYTLKVTDTQHCEDVSTVILGDGDGTLSIRSVDKQHPKCAGDNSGMITVNVFGGTAPYYYSLADTNYVESVNVFTGLTAGTYTVYVRDAQATPAKTTVVVTLEAASQLAVKAAVVGQKGNNVDVQVVATGGQVPYSYEMGGYFNTTDGLFTDMLSGSYTVYARDANNCEATTTVWAGDDHAGLPSITLEVIKGLLCAGTKTAEVKVTVTGGTAPYQYSADNVVWQTTDIITGLGAGKQTIYVKEANGKVTAAAVVITAPEALKLTVADITATTTADTADGAVTLLATGGRPDYLYSVDDKRYVSDARLDGLRSASYTATVKDANGCKASVPVTVSSADGGNSAVPVDMWAEVTGDITCAGDSNAVVTVHVRNIVDVDYSKDTTIAWTPDNILTGFGAGEAAVYVRDNATGNIGTLTISVKAPVAIQAAAFVSANLSEATAADGAFTVYAVGGTGQYTYAINGGAFHDNPVFSGLAAGTYIFDVKDGNGCQTTVQAVMTMVDVIVSATAIEVGEGEDPVAYTVRLSHQPTANVGLLNSIDSAGMLTITPNSMEYTTSGWNSQKLVKVGAVDNTLTDGTRSNKAIHEVAVTADDRYAGIERQVLVIARDNDYRDCQRLEQIVKQGFTLDGKTVIDQVTACLPEGTTMDLAIRHLNGTRFEWTIEGVDDDTKTTTSRASINVETPGTYSVVVTDRFGCVATSDEIVMNVQPAPKEPVFLVNENPDMLRPVAGKMYDYIVEAQDATFSWTFPTDWIVAPNTPDINGNIIPLIAGKEMGNVCVTVSDKTGLCPATNACLGVSSLQTGTANVSVYPTSLPADHNELWITPSGFDIDDVMVINKLGMQQSFTIQSTEGSLPIRNGVQAKIVVQNLSAGHYFLIFKGSNGETVSKIVVKE